MERSDIGCLQSSPKGVAKRQQRSNEASREKGRRPQGRSTAFPAKPLSLQPKTNQEFPLRGFSKVSQGCISFYLLRALDRTA